MEGNGKMETHTHCVLLFIATVAEHLVIPTHFLSLKESFQSIFLAGQEKTGTSCLFNSHFKNTECFCSCAMDSNYHTGAVATAVLHLKRQAPEETTEICLLPAAHTFGLVVQFSSEHLGAQIENKGTFVDSRVQTPSPLTIGGQTL